MSEISKTKNWGSVKTMPDKYNEHYNHILATRRKLIDHSWCRQQTRYDAEFVAWLDKELIKLGNEAFYLTPYGATQIQGDNK